MPTIVIQYFQVCDGAGQVTRKTLTVDGVVQSQSLTVALDRFNSTHTLSHIQQSSSPCGDRNEVLTVGTYILTPRFPASGLGIGTRQ